MTSDAALIAQQPDLASQLLDLGVLLRARWWADELQEPELREVGRRPLIHAKAR